MSEDFEDQISNALGSLAAGGSVPAGGAAAAQQGAAQRRRRGAVVTTMAAIVLLFGGVFGALQLLDDGPETTEFATETPDVIDGDGLADDDAVQIEPTPTVTSEPTVAPTPDTQPPNVPICAVGFVADGQDCVPDPSFAIATPTPATPAPATPAPPTPTPVPSNNDEVVPSTPGPTVTATPTVPVAPTLPPGPTPTATPVASSVTLSGTLTNSSGSAIPSAQISVSGVSSTTDSDGNYSLTVAPGDYVLGVFFYQTTALGGQGTSMLVHSQSFNIAADTTKDLVVQAPLTVNVTVVDANGVPSAFADVSIDGTVTSSHITGMAIAPLSGGLENAWGTSDTANSQGQATLYPYVGSNSIAVWASGVPSFNVPWDGVSTNVTVTIPGTVTVTGTVAGTDGTPLSNVNVAFPGSAGVLTNSSGQYSAQVNPGTMGVQLQSMSVTPGYNGFLFTAQPRSITAATTWDFTVATPTTLTVIVQDSQGGSLANYGVALSGGMESAYVPGTSVVDPSVDIDNGWWTSGTTNASGQATLRPYANDLSVSVTGRDGSAPQYFPWDGISSTLTVQIATNPTVDGQILRADGGTFGYCGISLSPGGGFDECDAGGSFSWPVPNGTYTPTVQGFGAPNHPEWIFTGAPITISGPQTFNITIASPATLSVTVLDASGNPLPSAQVMLRGIMTNAFVTGLVIDPNNPGADNDWFTSATTNTSGSATVYPFQTANTIEVEVEGAQQQTFAWDGVSSSVTVQLV